MINSIAGSGILSGLFSGIPENIVPIASGIGGAASLMGAYNRLGSIGEGTNIAAGLIGEEAVARSRFTPFTGTTGTGSSVSVGGPEPGSVPQMGRAAPLPPLMATPRVPRAAAGATPTD